MHGKRTTHMIEVSIYDKAEVLIDKLLKIEQAELLKYISIKLMHCMGSVKTLDLKKTIYSLGLKNDS